MKLYISRTAFLAFGTTALSACSLLFADAGTGPGGAADSSVSGADGGGVDAGPVVGVVDCTEAPAGCAVVEARDFERKGGVSADFHVANVAVAVSGSNLYVALQNTATAGDVAPTTVIAGETRWATWPTGAPADNSQFDDNARLCENSAACLGTLHLSVWKVPVATFAGPPDKCATGAREVQELTHAARHYCVGYPASRPTLDVVAAARASLTDPGSNEAIGAYIVDGQSGGRATSTSTSPLDADSAFGLWGGVVNSEFYAVYSSGGKLYRADSVDAGKTQNTPASSIRPLGAAISHADVAVANVGGGDLAYIAGVSPSNAVQFSLVARSWSDGSDVKPASDALPQLSRLGFTKRFVPSIVGATPEEGTNPSRAQFKPLLVRATSGGMLRLVGLNAQQNDSSLCDLRVAVQKDALRWETRTLESKLLCQKVSFDAALDGAGKLHVLYGQGSGTVGYKVVSP